MATTPVIFSYAPGITLKAFLYTEGSDTLANTAGGDTCTAQTNRDSFYTFDVTEAVTGWCDLFVTIGSGTDEYYVGKVLMADDTNQKETYNNKADAAGGDWLDAGRLDAILDQIAADNPNKVTKNVALANFPFLMVLASDDQTGATGLTVTATRSIDGAAFASCANSVSEIGNGWYKISLDAADLNGDTIALRFTASTANDRNITIITQP